MIDVSDEARRVITALFFLGPKSTVRSHPPHATVTKYDAAFRELMDKGLITKESYNNYDVWQYTGTEGCAAIADHERRLAAFSPAA